jgi:hypothetical protein
MRPAEGIIQVLLAAGTGTLAPDGTWPIYEGQFPTTGDDQCILVADRGGRSPEVRIAIDYPSIQILVRSSKQGYVAARAKSDEVFLALQGIPSEPASYPELTSCVAAGGITFVGYDENERPIWSQNFNLIVSKAPQGHRDL